MNILKGFSTRHDGNMYLGADSKQWDVENITHRQEFFERLGLANKKIVAANLVHGTSVARINTSSPEFILKTDALVTSETDIVLTLTGADCFPIFFEVSNTHIIGIAHAGWRGIVGGIVKHTIDEILALSQESAALCHPRDISATLGPGICPKHFEVGNDILSSFAEYPEAITHRDARHFVDLRAILTAQCIALGIPMGNIAQTDACTACLPETYFSYRRDKPRVLEAQVAYITQTDTFPA